MPGTSCLQLAHIPPVCMCCRGWVKHFFGCADCAEHFMMMAERPDALDVTSRRDAVLWMWKAHNEVCQLMLPAGRVVTSFTAERMQTSACLLTNGALLLHGAAMLSVHRALLLHSLCAAACGALRF